MAACGTGSSDGPVTHLRRLPHRDGQRTDWPAWVPAELRAALIDRGIERPWTHQAEAADLAHTGHDVMLATGTASGKSLAYQLPGLTALLTDPKACVLHLSPTKALAADQLASLTQTAAAMRSDGSRRGALAALRPAAYDGDTSMSDRDWAREHGRWILTNPDMLHRGLLPQHARWARVLRNLRFVVVDECHAYRGVFGSHVALVLRRLRRIAARYGSEPVFVLASATTAEPAVTAQRLTGRPAHPVVQDGAPRAETDFVLWEPAVLHDAAGEHGAPVRRSAPAEAARMLADLVGEDVRTLTFVRSRAGAEQTALAARRRLAESDPDRADRITAYRGGYLPEDRRALERSLDSGQMLGVASTNALELGVDITGLDAAVLAGYPGTLASVWQQAGRAGRRTERRSDEPRPLVVFVARDDPLDAYLVRHPERVFGHPVEASVIDPTNPCVLGPHLACAAAELHLTEPDLELFGGPGVAAVLDELVDRRVLRRRPHGWFTVDPGSPAGDVDLRGSGAQIAVVEAETGRMLGTVDAGRAPATVHPGAVHLHRGQTYQVLDLDLDGGVALVEPTTVEWTTVARSTSTVQLTGEHAVQMLPGGIRAGSGPVCVTGQVVGYLRRRPGGEVIDAHELDMPEHVLSTRAVWYSIPEHRLAAAGISPVDVGGALHAAEHAAIGLLPLFAGCDRWDIGGLSTDLHPDTGEPTVIVYDGYAGGAGFADRGHQVMTDWLTAVRDLVADCACAQGCPSCVQSPKCGNGNSPLDKHAAVRVLTLMVEALRAADEVPTAEDPRPIPGPGDAGQAHPGPAPGIEAA
ncbi:DEAD/DEAH box helicase [Nakamurella leprariae]|uniref:DEAD/DEAH box helicase n=1 Tax=Nakamurella leprariae TaxID=2803911 RepID=A0A939C1Q6_9ACTN|nr:DEAD/DEAH box helicase [Nakamurella leprariae]